MTEKTRKLFNKAVYVEKTLFKCIDTIVEDPRQASLLKAIWREVRQAWVLAGIEKGKHNYLEKGT